MIRKTIVQDRRQGYKNIIARVITPEFVWRGVWRCGDAEETHGYDSAFQLGSHPRDPLYLEIA